MKKILWILLTLLIVCGCSQHGSEIGNPIGVPGDSVPIKYSGVVDYSSFIPYSSASKNDSLEKK